MPIADFHFLVLNDNKVRRTVNGAVSITPDCLVDLQENHLHTELPFHSKGSIASHSLIHELNGLFVH